MVQEPYDPNKRRRVKINADAERKLFAQWASSATFKKQADDFEIHDSDELGRKLSPFLEKLGLVGKKTV
ncbi:hypothetical protein N7539_005313 [Penicillium diatomitis]|uniref:Uncharacterized protein n=1 Tax=Penicillium diatomitis TaxID=2819901 RepID=A0A9X0BV61_9EURO|nr:uncharacterized protein N7539_005313 [Penicillium diatomitis]KAJ5485325.1 hypothetical protein N7539_005313 [Penicillium diatomitis]